MPPTSIYHQLYILLYVPTLPTLVFLKIIFLGEKAWIGNILTLALLHRACVSSYSPFCICTDSYDDAHLAMTVSCLPLWDILLIEDIDCTFPSWDVDNMDELFYPMPQQQAQCRWANPYHQLQITLPGLLNVLDGIGSSGIHRWPPCSSN